MNMTTSTKVAIGVSVGAVAVLGYGVMIGRLMYKGLVKGEAFVKPQATAPAADTTVVDDIEIPVSTTPTAENGLVNAITFKEWAAVWLTPGEYQLSTLKDNALLCCEGKLEDHPYGESLAIIGETVYAHECTWYV